MDAVLPLIQRDVPRAQILFASLERFFEGLGTIFIVVPDAQRSAIEAALPSSGLTLVVLDESAVAPELACYPRIGGWYKQQLIKLAIADRVDSDFYMTFDGDVVATRTVSPARLCPRGKAPCYVIEHDLHPRWYRRTGHLIERPLVREGIVHNVTPAVLARGGVRLLAEHFESRFDEGRWARGTRAWHQRVARIRFGRRPRVAGWRLFLAAGLPWTEYALYYSFLEAHGYFDTFHERVDTCIYDIERSVWKLDGPEFETWSAAPVFEGEGPPYFVVLQSNTHIPAETVREKLAGYL